MHVRSERLDLFDRRVRQDAMAEIEDVARPSAAAVAGYRRLREQSLARSEQQRRIQIALNAAVVAQIAPRFVERLPPVDADDVAARLGDLGQDCRRADAEMDERDARVGERVEDPLRVRQRELAVVGAAECAGPGIEHLERLRSRVDLRAQVVGDHLGESIAEAMPRAPAART